MTTDRSHSVIDWPDAAKFGSSIRLQFSLFMSGLVLLIMIVTGVVISRQYGATVRENVTDRLLVQARSYSRLAAKHILAEAGPDALLLNSTCSKLQAESPDILWVGIADLEGKFLAHSDISQVVSGSTIPQIDFLQSGKTKNGGEFLGVRSDTIFVNYPIIEQGVQVGALGLAASADQIARAERQSLVTIGSITIAIIILTIPLIVVGLHRQLRPIKLIVGALQEMDPERLSVDIPYQSRNELGFLADTLRVLGAHLRDSQDKLLAQERVSRELQIAREIQASILPSEFPCGSNFEFAGAYQSAQEVGGDYYDFIKLPDGKMGFLVADVSGKSLPGMLIMLMTRDIVRRYSHLITEPSHLLREVNRELQPSIKKGMFVTMFYGIIDPDCQKLTFSSAGHNPLIQVYENSGEIKLHRPPGFPLGLMPPETFDARIQTETLRLDASQVILQYTDGVTEGRDINGEEFGQTRLEDIVAGCRKDGAEAVIGSILSEHKRFVGEAAQFDDITVMALKWRSSATNTLIKTNEEPAYVSDNC